MDELAYKKILKLVSQSMPGVDMSNVNENTHLIEDLRYDSLGLMMLIINVERFFNVSFNIPYHVSTIKDIYNFVIKNK